MNDLLETWLPNVSMIWPEVWDATYETLYMVIVGAVIGYAIGLVLGLLLLLTRRGGLTQNVIVYNILDKIVNIVRSIPFIILMALLVGVTRVIVGTSIGTEAMIVPIVGATVPFYARQVENALLEIDPGLVEAAKASGLFLLEFLCSILKMDISHICIVLLQKADCTVIIILGCFLLSCGQYFLLVTDLPPDDTCAGSCCLWHNPI